jgi:hypothetical protein
MDFVCDLLPRMAVQYNIAVDSRITPAKAQVVDGDADMGRGSSGIKDAGRLLYTLTPMSEEEATLFNIAAEDRLSYVGLDSAKINVVRRGGKAVWFKLVGVRIGNGTDEYPSGDEVQSVEPWSPPETWAAPSSVSLDAALTEIDEGPSNGQRYWGAAAAKTDGGWAIVQKHCPDKSEGQCQEIVGAWLKTGLLVSEDYDDPVLSAKRWKDCELITPKGRAKTCALARNQWPSNGATDFAPLRFGRLSTTERQWRSNGEGLPSPRRNRKEIR